MCFIFLKILKLRAEFLLKIMSFVRTFLRVLPFLELEIVLHYLILIEIPTEVVYSRMLLFRQIFFHELICSFKVAFVF
jgi:hypothetical protein